MPEITHAKLQRMQEEVSEFRRLKQKGIWEAYYRQNRQNKKLVKIASRAILTAAILGVILIYIFLF